MLVIDESHNFRNDAGERYQRLLGEVIQAGCKTKVLLLSATPVNTSLINLRNQIYLMTEGREQAFQGSLGVGNLRTLMGAERKKSSSNGNSSRRRASDGTRPSSWINWERISCAC